MKRNLIRTTAAIAVAGFGASLAIAQSGANTVDGRWDAALVRRTAIRFHSAWIYQAAAPLPRERSTTAFNPSIPQRGDRSKTASLP